MKKFIKLSNGLMVLSFCIILVSIVTGLGRTENTVHNGMIDVRNIDNQAVIPMKGDWEFYWLQLVTDDGEIENTEGKQMVKVPSNWSSYIGNDNKKLPIIGYAVYRIVVKGSIGDNLAIKIPLIGSSYQLWIDGKVRYASGKVGKSEEETKPKWSTKVVHFEINHDETEILLEVSNFDYFRAGLTTPIYIGTENEIQKSTYKNLFIDSFLFTALIVMAVYFFLLFLLHRRNKEHLYLSLFSANMALRPLLYGEAYFNYIFPNINFDFNTKIYLVNFIGLPLLYLYIYYQYEGVLSKKSYKIIGYPLIIIMLVGLLLPTKYMIYPVYMLELLIPVAFVCFFYLFYKAYKNNKNDVSVNVISVLLLFFLSIVDILHNNKVIQLNFYYVPIVLMIITFVQTFLQICKFKENLLLNERLVHEVDIKNLKIEYEAKHRIIAEKLNTSLKTIISKFKFTELLTSILDNLNQFIEIEYAEIDNAEIMINVDEKLSYHAIKVNNNKTVCSKIDGNMDFSQYGIYNHDDKSFHIMRQSDETGTINQNVLTKSLYYKNKLFCIIRLVISTKEETIQNDLQVIDIYCDECGLALQNAMAYKRVKEMAMFDELTMIYNRRYFLKLSMNEFYTAGNSDNEFGVIMLDIDNFKLINDNYGHLYGDYVIRSIADMCKKIMPDDAITGRYGGEEYTIFIKDMKQDDMISFAEKLRGEVDHHKFVLENDSLHVTISIGIAMKQKDKNYSLHQVINNADNAMYLAKSDGKNCIRIHNR